MRISNGSLELNLTLDGDPEASPILFLHGITMSVATWDFLVPALAEESSVWRLDFRGHGESDRAPGEYQPANYISDAVAAIESGVGRPCVVVGHSLGGLTAAGLAQQRPDLVTAILLEDPALFDADAGSMSPSDAMGDNTLLELFRMMHRGIPALQQAGMAEDDLAAMLASGPSTSGRPAGEVYHPDTFAGWAHSQLRLDVGVLEPVIDPSAVDPADVAAGAFDPKLPIEVAGTALAGDPDSPDTVLREPMIARLAETSPGLRVDVVEGAGHMIHDELNGRHRFMTALQSVLA